MYVTVRFHRRAQKSANESLCGRGWRAGPVTSTEKGRAKPVAPVTSPSIHLNAVQKSPHSYMQSGVCCAQAGDAPHQPWPVEGRGHGHLEDGQGGHSEHVKYGSKIEARVEGCVGGESKQTRSLSGR